jgi:hypothetical protein
MPTPIPVRCECGKVVPAYIYCDGCKKVSGSPNCPCGKALKGVRNWRCPSCVPMMAEGISVEIRDIYYRKTGLCDTGNCQIPRCPTCGNAEHPIDRCGVCQRDECSACVKACNRKLSDQQTRKPDSTVTYSGTKARYKKGADKDRPAAFVESWYYKGGRLIARNLVGFEQKREA